jgi:hypothetical protein
MLPAEGDVNAHALFRETNILYALDQMKSGKWKQALLLLQKAETWPQNLFSGEPYLADNRMTQFLAAYCNYKLKDQPAIERSYSYVKDYKNPYGWTSNSGNQLSEEVRNGNRNYRLITESLLKSADNDRDKDIIARFLTIL